MAGEFAQAYDEGVLASCVRYLLFLRPDKVVVVDLLRAPAGKEIPQVQWLLQLPREPREDGGGLVASNGKSWIRCRAVLPGNAAPVISATPVNTHRVSLAYSGKAELALVHLLEVGDGTTVGPPVPVVARQMGRDIQVTVDGRRYVFAGKRGYRVTCELLMLLVQGEDGRQGGLHRQGRVGDVATLRDVSLGVVVGVAIGPRPDVDYRGAIAGPDK